MITDGKDYNGILNIIHIEQTLGLGNVIVALNISTEIRWRSLKK